MEPKATDVQGWKTSSIEAFWGEIAPTDHLVQVYEDEETLLDTLEGFARTGILADNTVAIIATARHLNDLNTRLGHQGLDLNDLIATDQYIIMDAEALHSISVVDNRINANIFSIFISDLILRANQRNCKLRIFSEMVAVSWKHADVEVALRLEELWNKLQAENPFTLYCAYRNTGIENSHGDTLDLICRQHSRVIDGQPRSSTEISYMIA